MRKVPDYLVRKRKMVRHLAATNLRRRTRPNTTNSCKQQSYPFQVDQFLANIAEGTGALSGSPPQRRLPAVSSATNA